MFAEECRKKAAMEEKVKTEGREGLWHAVIAFCLPRGRPFAAVMRYEICFCYTDGAQNVKECTQNGRCERLLFHRMQVFLKKISRNGKKTSDTLMRKRFPLRISTRV